MRMTPCACGCGEAVKAPGLRLWNPATRRRLNVSHYKPGHMRPAQAGTPFLGTRPEATPITREEIEVTLETETGSSSTSTATTGSPSDPLPAPKRRRKKANAP